MLYITSFPRSGNTFFRYCVEYLTDRSTLGCIGSDPDIPIHKRNGVKGLDVNGNNPVARKAHKWRKISDQIDSSDSLILIIRDYKECLLRHSRNNGGDVDKILNDLGENYFNLIEKYDDFEGNKSLFYYEDLIGDEMKLQIRHLKKFLVANNIVGHIDDEKVENFVNKLEWYRKDALTSYDDPSVTKGNSKKFHQQRLSDEETEKMDDFFWKRNKTISNKYLLFYREQESNYDIDMKLGFHGDTKLIEAMKNSVSKSDIFLETGTYLGYSIGYTANEFPSVDCYSCEIDEGHFENSNKYCGFLDNVNLYKKDAAEFLSDVVHDSRFDLSEQIFTIWSDAHGFGFEWPLREEIEIITKNFENAFLFIDDFKVPDKDRFGFDMYQQQECSFDYIKGNIFWEDYELYYPNYEFSEIREDAYHPLRGWGLITNVENDIEKFDFVDRVK